MNNDNYKFWSKLSIYLKAVRDEKLHCTQTAFYKDCRLLGFENKPRRRKSDDYCSVKIQHQINYGVPI